MSGVHVTGQVGADIEALVGDAKAGYAEAIDKLASGYVSTVEVRTGRFGGFRGAEVVVDETARQNAISLIEAMIGSIVTKAYHSGRQAESLGRAEEAK